MGAAALEGSQDVPAAATPRARRDWAGLEQQHPPHPRAAEHRRAHISVSGVVAAAAALALPALNLGVGVCRSVLLRLVAPRGAAASRHSPALHDTPQQCTAAAPAPALSAAAPEARGQVGGCGAASAGVLLERVSGASWGAEAAAWADARSVASGSPPDCLSAMLLARVEDDAGAEEEEEEALRLASSSTATSTSAAAQEEEGRQQQPSLDDEEEELVEGSRLLPASSQAAVTGAGGGPPQPPPALHHHPQQQRQRRAHGARPQASVVAGSPRSHRLAQHAPDDGAAGARTLHPHRHTSHHHHHHHHHHHRPHFSAAAKGGSVKARLWAQFGSMLLPGQQQQQHVAGCGGGGGEHPAVTAHRLGRLGFAFSGGGFFFP